METTCFTVRQFFILTVLTMIPLTATAQWEVSENQSRRSASTYVKAENGAEQLDFSCRDGEIYIVFFDYPGNAISRVDTESMQIRIVFTNADGSPLRTFTEAFHYFAPDQAHVLSETAGSPMADAWGAGSTMIFQSTSGEEVARFDLTGTSRARERFRQVCGV